MHILYYIFLVCCVVSLEMCAMEGNYTKQLASEFMVRLNNGEEKPTQYDTSRAHTAQILGLKLTMQLVEEMDKRDIEERNAFRERIAKGEDLNASDTKHWMSLERLYYRNPLCLEKLLVPLKKNE